MAKMRVLRNGKLGEEEVAEDKLLLDVKFEASNQELGLPPHSGRMVEVRKHFADSFKEGLEVAKSKDLVEVKIRRAEKSSLTGLSSLMELEREFILSRKSKGNTDKTIRSYKDNFVRLYDFIGYANTQTEEAKEAMANTATRYEGFNERRIGQLSPMVVLEEDNFEAYFREYLLKIRLLSKYTMESTMRHYRAIAYYAMEQGWIREKKIPLIESKPQIKPTLTEDEMKRLSKEPPIDDYVPYRTWVMLHCFASTGNRISSVLGLLVEDIDFENNAIIVQIQKNKDPKQMPLLHPLARILRRYIAEYRSDDNGMPLVGEPLFPNQFGQPMGYRTAYDAFDDYYAARGVAWNGFHKFRHSYAANWIRQGGNPFMLKEQLGHSTLAQTNRYANIYGMATKEEAEAFSLSKKMVAASGRKKITRKK